MSVTKRNKCKFIEDDCDVKPHDSHQTEMNANLFKMIVMLNLMTVAKQK